MNRTVIIVAVLVTGLLGAGGWYTRGWWWGTKPAEANADQQAAAAAEKTSPEKKTLGASEPATRLASARMNSRFDKEAGALADHEEPLSSDELNDDEGEASPPPRPSNRFTSRAAQRADEEDALAADEDEDAYGSDGPVDPMSDAPEADDEPADDEEEMTAGEEDEEEPAAPTPLSFAGDSGDDEEEEEPAEEETDEAPVARPPSRFGAAPNTSRAPPLRGENDELPEEEEPSETPADDEPRTIKPSPPPAPTLPEDEIIRIQEPPRAARTTPPPLAEEPEVDATPRTAAAPQEESPRSPRSLRVAQPLESPPRIDAGSRIGGGELAGLLARVATAPREEPGDRRLEGEQASPITLTKVAPSEVSVGRPALFETRVRNNGTTTAQQVVVMDRVPRGARLVDASPRYTETPEGLLVWDIGSLDPGQEAIIKMQVLPEEEGEIGSVASVTFQVTASARTISTRPQLEVEHTAPAKVLIGDDVRFSIRVHNPGSGVARNVRIEEDVPRGLYHEEGRQLEHEIGDLRPGETRQLELILTASEAGLVTNVIRVRGEGDLMAEHTAELEVLAPKLLTEIQGPKRRYLDRQATYSLRIANPGTASAKSVEFTAQLPPGMKFVSADNSGRYDARKHAVFWKVENLPAGQEGVVQLVLLSTTSGQQMLRVGARASGGLETASELPIIIEAAPETTFTVRDTSDPIEVGAESVYEILVLNQGTRADSDVQITAVIPAEMEIVGAEGPTAHRVEGQRIRFEPIARLDPKSEAVYRIKVRALSAAPDPRVVKVQATSSTLSTPVSREESTLIYEDQ